jgi:hypothetical protein
MQDDAVGFVKHVDDIENHRSTFFPIWSICSHWNFVTLKKHLSIFFYHGTRKHIIIYVELYYLVLCSNLWSWACVMQFLLYEFSVGKSFVSLGSHIGWKSYRNTQLKKIWMCWTLISLKSTYLAQCWVWCPELHMLLWQWVSHQVIWFDIEFK